MILTNKPRFSVIAQSLFYGVGIVFFLILSFICFRWALADIYAEQVRYILEKEDDSNAKANVLAWQRAEEHLQKALLLRPKNPKYLELAENYYQTLHGLDEYESDLTQALARNDYESNALQYVRQALPLKPSWAYLWEGLTVTKMALNQFDSEQAGAYQNALKLGAWEQTIQYRLALLGFDNWDNLGNDSKFSTLQATEQSLILNKVNPYRENLTDLLTHENISKICKKNRESTLNSMVLMEQYCHSEKM